MKNYIKAKSHLIFLYCFCVTKIIKCKVYGSFTQDFKTDCCITFSKQQPFA